jgi:TolB-like protein
MRPKECYAPLLIAAVGLIALFSIRAAMAQDYEHQLSAIAQDLSAAAEKAETKALAVLDFTDLQGNVTELGRFLAEELGSRLVAPDKPFKVIDRANLKFLLDEHKLTMSGLVNPANAKQLGQIAGVDALVLGTTTALSENVKLSVKLLSVDTAMIIGTSRGDLARTKAIEELLAQGIEQEPAPIGGGSQTQPTQVPGYQVRDRGPKAIAFQNALVKLELMSLNKSQDGTVRSLVRITNLGNGALATYMPHASMIDSKGIKWTATDLTGMSKASYNPTVLSPKSENTFGVAFKSSEASDGANFNVLLELHASTTGGKPVRFDVSIQDAVLSQ